MNDLFYKYFLLGLIILSFVLNPFAKKQASKSLKASEYFLINQIIIVILVIFYSIYLFYNNHCDINCIKKMSSKEIMWSVFAGFIGIIGSVALIAVIQLDEISFIELFFFLILSFSSMLFVKLKFVSSSILWFFWLISS